jgi:hypothetical protein
MPHSLVLIFGDTVRAAEAFDRDLGPEVPRIVLVDTFRDEAEETLRVAHALGDRLYGIRLDTPAERGRVTADLVHEIRARLDNEGYQHVKIVVSGGLNPERIQYFKDAGAPVDSYAVGSYISGADPDRLHRRHQGDRRPADREARPDPGPDRLARAAPRRPRAVAGRRLRLAAAGRDSTVRATICAWISQTATTTANPPTSCFQRGRELIRTRHHAQAAIVLERALRLGTRQGLDPRGARPGLLQLPPVRALARDDSRRSSRSIRRATTATSPWARASSSSAGRRRPGRIFASRSR